MASPAAGRTLLLPRAGLPRPDEWRAFVAGIAQLRGQRDFSLVLIDPPGRLLPRTAVARGGG
jgi:hypothetical protein